MRLGLILLAVLALGSVAAFGAQRALGGGEGSRSALRFAASPGVPSGRETSAAVEENSASGAATAPCPPTPPDLPTIHGVPLPLPTCASLIAGEGEYAVSFRQSRVRFTAAGEVLEASIDPQDTTELMPLMRVLGPPPGCQPVPPPPWFAFPNAGGGMLLPPPVPSVGDQPLPLPFCSTIYPDEDGGYTVVFGTSYVRFTKDGLLLEASVSPDDADDLSPLTEALRASDGTSP
jgi:hypothetical protein